MMFLRILVTTGVLVLLARAAGAAPIVELKTADKTFQGMRLAHDREVCWLIKDDGSLQHVSLAEVIAFRKTGQEFTAKTPNALADEIRKGLPRGMDVQVRGKFVVIAPQNRSRAYADAVANVENAFRSDLSRRNWTLDSVPYPLVTVVHASRADFDAECHAAGMPISGILKGFYHPQSNRVTLYDIPPSPDTAKSRAASGSGAGEIPEEVRETLTHETIHQLAFNSGLHSRLAQMPRWVVEGLAVNLEGSALNANLSGKIDARINKDRFDQFQENRAKGTLLPLADLIADGEQYYATNPLGFYGESWALTFYLSEKRRPEYLAYLKKLAARDPLKNPYSPADRLADFQTCFGTDLKWMEVQFLRFMESLPSDPPATAKK